MSIRISSHFVEGLSVARAVRKKKEEKKIEKNKGKKEKKKGKGGKKRHPD